MKCITFPIFVLSMRKLNRIKEILFMQGKTQTWLASQLGKSREVVSNYANNRRQPSIETLNKIAEILDVEVRELLVPSKEG